MSLSELSFTVDSTTELTNPVSPAGQLPPVNRLYHEKIVFPTDFAKETGKLLSPAAQLTRQFNTDLYLVHVLSTPFVNYPPRMPAMCDEYQQSAESINNAFEELKAISCLMGVRTYTHILTGAAPVDLLNHQHFADANLLIMASTGATGLKEFLFGSTAEALIREARMPVLVVKTPPASIDFKTVVFTSNF